jgi:hypothetical protein
MTNPTNAAVLLRVAVLGLGYVRVQYTGGNVVVENVTWSLLQGFQPTTIGSFPATLNAGDTLTARSNLDGTVDVWINAAYIGTSSPGSASSNRYIGMQLNSGTVVDNFAGGNTP